MSTTYNAHSRHSIQCSIYLLYQSIMYIKQLFKYALVKIITLGHRIACQHTLYTSFICLCVILYIILYYE